MIELFFKLLIGHALADFSLQHDPMAKGKNRHNRTMPPLGQKYVPCWYYWLTAHALIHGGVVWIITGSMTFGIIETLIHWIADFMKCDNLTSPNTDQAIHIGSKLVYAWMLT